MTPTQRSLAMLRKDGWTVAVVEKWVPYPPPGHRVDVWGFGDLLAVHPATGETALIQTTSGPNLAARRTKIESIPEAGLWLECGNTIYLHGWRKTKPRGEKVAHWSCIVESIRAEDIVFDSTDNIQEHLKKGPGEAVTAFHSLR